MQIQNIFSTWGSVVTTSREEFMADNQTNWPKLVLDRNLIVLKGFKSDLTDEEYFNFGKKFGQVWTIDDYRRPHVGASRKTGVDPTIANATSETPVSHFKSSNNVFRDDVMGYHADMAHIGEKSYPGRALYMTRNTLDGSGVTTWLNMESGWEQCTEQEKAQYANVEIANHNMYLAGHDLQILPFLKTNPKTGKVSPRINNLTKPGNTKTETSGWVNHIRNNGAQLSWNETTELVTKVIKLLESKSNTLYDHHWDDGDIIVYDNWFNVHKRNKVNPGAPGGRLLRRLTFNFE